MQRHGVGNWSAVVRDAHLKAARTNVHVKDKWRTLTRQPDRLAELAAMYGPLRTRRRHSSRPSDPRQ